MTINQIRPRANILGVGISAISLNEAVQTIGRWIAHSERHYINVCTVHTVMECFYNEKLREIVNHSSMATPDGMPLVWLAHHYGFHEATRVYGPDLMLAICKYSTKNGHRHFFYGGDEGVADQLSKVLKDRYPGIQIAGSYSPPYRDVGYIEETSIIESINNASPDIVWVGLGTPKQDFWVAQHRAQLKAPILIAVGAAFDFHTGRVRQAPVWVQKKGLEWLFRLSMEPRRLAYRYLKYNPLFIILITLQLMKVRKYSLL
jgi:N-acetylglucosaminyldiphosphoundecaprenol N-acetyl-beta-D-mannosaminyltransferase